MGIVFSECSGLNDDLWKVEGQIVKSFLQDTDTEKNKYDDFVNAVFNVKKSKKFAEKSSGLTEFESGKIVDEGENGVQDEIQQGFSKMIEHVQFIKTFACTANMREDGDIDAMKTAAKNFDMSYKRTRCEMGSSALTTEGATYIYGGRTGLDKTTGDGLGLFNTAHVAKKSGVATQSNVFTNAFGTTSAMLNRLQNIGRNYKNDSGIVMGNTFDTIIIPSNCYELEDTIKKIIRTDLMVGSNYNDVNTQKGLWNLIVDPSWQVADGKAPYILMSSEFNKSGQCAMFYDRIPLTVDNWVDHHSANLEWSGRYRIGTGFNRWQAFILGGADSGITLS